MSGGNDLEVDPAQLASAGGRWVMLVPDLQGVPPGGATGPYPSAMGAMAVTGAAGEATGALQAKLGAHGANATASGEKYAQTDSGSSSAMKDAISMSKEVVTGFTGALQALAGIGGSLSSAASGAASAAASAATSLWGAWPKWAAARRR